MDIVLGVSMTPAKVRMVLVEGEKADGVTVDHDVFEVASIDGSANVTDQVVAAVLGTRESVQAGGHHLKAIGVTWSDHAEVSALRDGFAAGGIDDVMLVSEGHAAASLAQAVGQAVGYASTALLFVNRDVATLSVVRTDDGSVLKVLSRTLRSADAMAVLTEMADVIAAWEAPPEGIFVVGSGVDIGSVKANLEKLVPVPVNAPEEAELALARGAALASASAPTFEASTVGLAYSKDPDGSAGGTPYAVPASVDTQLAPVATAHPADDVVDEYAQTQARAVEDERKPFLLVGSALTSIFVVGVVALAISLAVSIRPTADQRPSPAEGIIVPSSQVPAPVQEALQPVDPPVAETIKPPVPVVQQAPVQAPRTVYVEQAPAPAPPAPAATAAAPAVAPPSVPAPVVVPPPVVILPPSQWPLWRPSQDSGISSPAEPQVPQSPQYPQVPQAPQQPQQPGGGADSSDGSIGSGSGSGDGSIGSGSGSGDGSGVGSNSDTSDGSSGSTSDSAPGSGAAAGDSGSGSGAAASDSGSGSGAVAGDSAPVSSAAAGDSGSGPSDGSDSSSSSSSSSSASDTSGRGSDVAGEPGYPTGSVGSERPSSSGADTGGSDCVLAACVPG